MVQLSNIPKDNEVVTMFRDWKDEIVNSFIRFGDRILHNGYMEEINNRIKI